MSAGSVIRYQYYTLLRNTIIKAKNTSSRSSFLYVDIVAVHDFQRGFQKTFHELWSNILERFSNGVIKSAMRRNYQNITALSEFPSYCDCHCLPTYRALLIFWFHVFTCNKDIRCPRINELLHYVPVAHRWIKVNIMTTKAEKKEKTEYHCK